MGSFITWFCKRIGKKKLRGGGVLSSATDQFDLVNPEGHRLGSGVSVPDFGDLKKLSADTMDWLVERSMILALLLWYLLTGGKRKRILHHKIQCPRSVRSWSSVHMRVVSVVSLKTYERYSYLYGYGVCRQKGYVILGIGQTRFLVKSWRLYAVSPLLDTAYSSEISNIQISSF
ncbi:hypothetical protein Tco_0469316 [Tanacetum coccineum]